MDGLSDTVPVGIPEDNFRQMTLFDGDEEEAPSVDCKIYDWRKDRSKIFKKIKDKTERGVNMKFDYVIGIIWSPELYKNNMVTHSFPCLLSSYLLRNVKIAQREL